MTHPLDGVKVVSIENSVSGPFCTGILSDFGAEVIKVERPGVGDPAREWDTVAKGLSSSFVALNANKKSLSLDIKKPKGHEILLKLIADADIFLHNLTPSAISRLKLDYGSLKDRYPKLIYCGITGYGKDGPYSNVKAYDLLVQGESGVINLTGYPDSPAKVALSICDLSSGMYASQAILLSLIHRGRTGEGQEVDISMLESVISWYLYFQYHAWYKGEVPPRTGMRHQIFCPYGPFLASDGRYVNIAVLSNQEWARICTKVFKRDDLLHDTKFLDNEKRVSNRNELERIVEEIISQKDHAYWLSELQKAGIACGRVNTVEEVLEHPQIAFRNIIREVESRVGLIKQFDSPIRLSKAPAIRKSIPELGQDNDQILGKLGYSQKDIQDLKSEGVI